MTDLPAPSMRDLAQRLLAAEEANPSASQPHLPEAVRVCEKLRVSLTRFAGADGFKSLLRRALALARADFPALRSVEVKADGSLDGLVELTADARSENHAESDAADAALAITTQLLSLLVTFIGKPLTLRLVREVWPGVALDE